MSKKCLWIKHFSCLTVKLNLTNFNFNYVLKYNLIFFLKIPNLSLNQIIRYTFLILNEIFYFFYIFL